MTTSALDWDLLRRDVLAFSRWLGAPLSAAQAQALSLETHTTVVAAPRGSGKSRAAAVLALHQASTAPGTRVLIVSAGETAARRLLSEVKSLAGPLVVSFTTEQADLVMLDNGSEIRSLPSSEAAIRGWRAKIVCADEASLIPDSIFAAVRPTMAGRDDARLVLLSTPQGAAGHFAAQFFAGQDPDNPFVRSFEWSVQDAPWITPAHLAAERAALPPSVYAREYECSFAEAQDAFFTTSELRHAVGAYALLNPADARGEQVIAGMDWARLRDESALVAVGMADDHGRNLEPPLIVAWAETFSRMEWRQQLAHVSRIAQPWQRQVGGTFTGGRPLPGGGRFHETGATFRDGPISEPSGFHVGLIVSEVTGIGSMPTSELAYALPGVEVHPWATTNTSKIEAYSALRSLVVGGRLALPPYEPMLRQLGSLVVSDLPGGSIRIAHRVESDRDDLPDALALACWGLIHEAGLDMRPGEPTPEPEGVQWATTGHGVAVPVNVRPRKGGLASNRKFLIAT